MKQRQVEISEDARGDLVALYDWVAEAASPAIALGYIERIEQFINGFDIASERGSLRDDIRPGLRVVGFERRVSIAFTVEEERVIILRIFYGGQNWSDKISQ